MMKNFKSAQAIFSLVLFSGFCCEGAERHGYTVSEYELYNTDNTTLADYVFPEYDESVSDPAAIPPLEVKSDGSPQKLAVSVGEPFTVMQAHEGHVIIHPHLTHWGDGKMLLQVSPDMDIAGSEEFVLSSSDGGKSWEEVPGWPFGDNRGRHISFKHTQLPDGRSLVVSRYLVSTGKENEYILPVYISSEDEKSFTEIKATPFELNWGRVRDMEDAAEPGMKRGGPQRYSPDYGKVPGKPTQLMKDFREKYGKYTLTAAVESFHVLDDETLLVFVQVSNTPRGERSKFSVFCLESKDWGRSWALRSVPGPYDPVLQEKNRRKKPIDGFCEPYVTRLKNGNHLIIMRLGAWQRLYSAVSTDECRTWSKPTQISVFGILPKVLTLPDGTLALCSGRPDNTLSFSFDNGYTWPWTLTLLDQTLPEHPSTRNNTLIQVSPGRLLYMYDMGYRRPDPEVEVPHAIKGVFIDVSTSSE